MHPSNKTKSYRHRSLRNSFLSSNPLQNAINEIQLFHSPHRPHQQETIAKGVLIEIGESELSFNQHPSLFQTPVSIKSWIDDCQVISTERKSRPLHTQMSYTRNTKSMNHNQSSELMDIEANTFSKLKTALKNLESPEKLKQAHRQSLKENKTAILQSLIKKRMHETKVSDLIRSRPTSNQKQKSTTDKLIMRKISTSNERRCCNSSTAPNYEKPLQLKLMNQLFNFKEARKSRTLKNILQ